MEYHSIVWKRSEKHPEVEFAVARISLARRIELGKKVREVGCKEEFLQAGKSFQEEIEAGILRRQIERIYLEWGFVQIRGLSIDGSEADPALVIERGPEELIQEILAAIRSELHLTEEERKN